MNRARPMAVQLIASKLILDALRCLELNYDALY